jgi:hypothetical protein
MRVYLYATRADYEPVIQEVEARRGLQYILYGNFEDPDRPIYP